MKQQRRGETRRRFLAATAALALAGGARAEKKRSVYIVPNFHPASCGWLTNFSMERVYCANSYFDHLDRVRDDPNYEFVLSECNNMIAMMNFQPGRTEELKRRIREGRVELVNAFFLESTINLSGGEALVRLGIEGLRWQQQVFGVRPRFAWCIDVCGTHDQMAQITAGLGLEAIVYTRKNPTGSGIHWLISPDGTRTVAVASGHYSELGPVFATKGPLNQEQIAEIQQTFSSKEKIMPAGAPILILGGNGDYALAPARHDYPSAFLREWGAIEPTTEIRFTTLSKYMDQVLAKLKSGEMQVPELKGGTAYDFHSFWIQNPRIKTGYRRSEHGLQAAEMLASIASLESKNSYPAERLYQAWLQMCLLTDRNTLWGAAGGMVFENSSSWDARDRLEAVQTIASEITQQAAQAMAGAGGGAALYNSLNWKRSDPVVLPAEMAPAGASAEALPGGKALCRVELGPVSITQLKRAKSAPAMAQPCALPERIETEFYTAIIDGQTGALISLMPKPSGRELLGGAGNVVVAERSHVQGGDPGDFVAFRPQRSRVASTSDSVATITATCGPMAITVMAESPFAGGGVCRRNMRFYRESPRIDFETTLNDIPDLTVVVAEFPMERDILEVRRGIPFGFSHGAWARPNPELHGWTKDIVPAVRWSHYSVEGGGLAILDQGLSGRELNGRTPVIYLLNASDKYYGYPNSWLSGQGEHTLRYAVVAHDGDWRAARIPQMAWEYNSPPVAVHAAAGDARSFLETSDNVIVESMRRDRGFLEVRLAECLGYSGTAQVRLHLPHEEAAITNLVGADAKPLGGGPAYEFAVRPQQIVTLRFRTAEAVPAAGPLLEWDALVPLSKRAALHHYSSEKGLPPRGN